MSHVQSSAVEPDLPSTTPWGLPQSTSRLAVGVWSASTASHGGIWLSPARNATVPDYMRDDNGWYEEDVAWAVAAAVHSDAFSIDQVEAAFKTLRIWAPDAYELYTGQKVAPGESHLRDRQVFYRENPLAWVVSTAWGDHANWVEPGHVGVTARQGPPGTSAYVTSSERYFMVPAEEYCANTSVVGFHIDLGRHREVAKPADFSAKRSDLARDATSRAVSEQVA